MSVTTFNSVQFGNLRTHQTERGNVWFCLSDVANALGLEQVSRLKSRLDEKGVTTIKTPTNGGMQELNFINEPNLYRCIFQSRKAEAEQFQNWVFEEVLPSIRQSGGYIATHQDDTPELIMARALQIAQTTIERHKQQLEQANERISLQDTQLKQQAPKVEYYDTVLQSVGTMTTRQLAASIGMTANTLNKKLCGAGIQFRQSGMYILRAPYSSYHLTSVRSHPYTRSDGQIDTKQYLVWNERGKQFVTMLHKNNFDAKKTREEISPDFWLKMLRPKN